MKKLIQNSTPTNTVQNNPSFAFFTQAALNKTQQQRLKGGNDGDGDIIIVEDEIEG